MDTLELMLKEYETLRQESLDSINNRSQIVSFGLATIGLIVAAIFALDSSLQSTALVVLVFSVGIPIISVLILYIWLGEVERMMRAGDYLCGLEARINDVEGSGTAPLQWEQWLRSTTKQMKYPYIVVIVLFLGFAYTAPVVGFVEKGLTVCTHWWVIAIPWLVTLPFVAHIHWRTRSFK